MKPYVTEEQIRAAKAVNTLAFLLRHQPERFKRVGCTEHAHCDHDSLKVSSNGKWNWHSKGVGGTTAVQYLIKVEGYDFVRAVQIVCADAPFLSSPPVIKEKNSGFALPPRGDNFKAYQYLAGRGVCDEVLAFCFHTGRVYTTFTIPFSIWLMSGFMSDMPMEIEEAAMIDGCNRAQAFVKVELPMLVPSIIACGVYIFMNAWNEYTFAVMFTNENNRTISVALKNLVGQLGVEWDLMTAGGLIAVLPICIMFFFAQKRLVAGLTAGAVKG